MGAQGKNHVRMSPERDGMSIVRWNLCLVVVLKDKSKPFPLCL